MFSNQNKKKKRGVIQLLDSTWI